MKSYNDTIIPALGVEAVQKTLVQTLDANESMFKANREQLVDFYFSQQTDKDEYLRDFFNRETDPNEDPDYPHNLVLTQRNITAKIINAKAKNYIVQPVRELDGEDSDSYNEMLLNGGIKTSSKLVNRLTWLLGDNCVVIIADKNTQKIRIDNPPYYRPIFNGTDRTNPVAVIYPIGLVRNKKNEMVEGWQYWDAESSVIFEGGVWEVISKEDNPHGCFNVLFTHRMKPFRGHWTQDAQDLIDANRDINVALTSINNALRYQGFPILAALGISPEEAKKVKIGFDKLIGITASAEGATIGLDFVYPSVDWDKLINVVKFQMESIALTWNVNINWNLEGDISSGIALEIKSIDNTDDKNEMCELLEEYFEIPLFEKIKIISRNIEWMQEIKSDKLVLDWQESHNFESQEERAKRLETDISLNLTNPIDELMLLNPDLTEEEAMKKYKRNIEMNSLSGDKKPADRASQILVDREKRKSMKSLEKDDAKT